MTPDIAALVEALPERYQPIFGEADTEPAARRCDDRLAAIASVVGALRERLGRPVRVLDLGCAQGYFSLSLAALGAQVTGVERGPANVALCRALAARRPDLPVAFVEADIVEHAAAIAPGDADVVIALSVVHHVAHEQSPSKARQLLSGLADRCELLLVETALRAEPVYWSRSLPADPREHLADVPFVHALARFPTHLSHVLRPLFFASARWWCLGDSFERFDRWTAQPHEFGANVHRGTRRYYFGRHFAKHYLLEGEAAVRNTTELARESAFLREPPAGFTATPRVLASGEAQGEAYLVREIVAGSRLSEVIAAGGELDAMRVIGDVLDELCRLEAAGRYHGDVRPWNVIVKESGRATLIDYGDITTEAADCAWPGDPFIAFMVFAHEVQSRRVHPPSDLRSIRFAPHGFEGALHAWATHLWCASDAWTFASMREALHRACREGAVPPAQDIARAERNAGERVQALLAARHTDIDALHLEKVAIQEQLAREHGVRVEAEQALAESGERGAREAGESAARERTAGSRIAEVAQQLDASERARQDALEEIQRRVSEVDASRAREAQLAHAHEALTASNAELGAANENLRDANARLASSHAGLAAALAQLEGANATLRGDHAALAAQCESLDAQRVAAHGEAHRWWQQSVEWHREWQAIQQTRSWRLTAPMRWGKRSAVAAMGAARAGPSVWLRAAVTALARPFMERPALRYRVATMTRRFPSLHGRIRDYVKMPAEAVASEPGEETPGAPDYLTPRARQVLRDLARLHDGAPRP